MKLLSMKGFFPYMMLVFFNTFIDLGHKILIQDTIYQTTDSSAYTVLSAIINALILLPYILLFTPSGFIADKFSKKKVLQYTAAAAIPLTILVTWCYFKGFFWGSFLLTLLLAVQSALNSPAKYGYIKEVFSKQHLSQVNAIVQTLTIIAILGATFAFTSIFNYYMNATGLQQSHDKTLLLKAFAPAGFLLIAFSIFETMMTFRLVKSEAVDPHSHYEVENYLKGRYLKSYLNKTLHPPAILTCILGLSVFWAVNQVLLASYGAFLKEHIGNVSIMFAQGSLAMGGIGILLGALYAGKVSKGFVETGLIPVATIGIATGLLILPFLHSSLMIVLLFLVYGFFGGMLIVPLNSLIQFNAPRQEIGKVLSANNFLQNCFMLTFLGLTVLAGLAGVDSQALLFSLFIIALTGAIYTLVTLPQSLVRYLLYFITSRFYKLSVYELDNLPSSGGILLLGNHVSFIDWAVLQIACPRPIRFVMDRSIYEAWYLKWLLKKFKAIPIARGSSQEALSDINQALNTGEVVALFPEGRLTKNGQLGIFRSGFERSAVNANAVIIPFYIHGLWGSRVSYGKRYKKKLMNTHSRHISVTYGPAMDIASNAQAVKQNVSRLSIKAWKYHIDNMSNLQTEWLYQMKKNPAATTIIEENGNEITARELLGNVLFLSKKIKHLVGSQLNTGILLPTNTAGIITNLSLLTLGKVIVNLNLTQDEAALKKAIEQAGLKTIITSRQITIPNVDSSVTLIYWEDLTQHDLFLKWTMGFLAKWLPVSLLKLSFLKNPEVNSTAAILFNQDRGVKLSHANLLSNINQIASVFGIEDGDVMMSSLPLYQAFGLTVTILMPLLKGIPIVCYPEPSDSLAIARLIYHYKATLFCSTPSLLELYLQNPAIHAQMLKSLRMVIAETDSSAPSVYKAFKERFNLEIYEGYGAVEVSPVASCNLPDVISTSDWHVHQAGKAGTVGLPLPGYAFRIVDPITLQDLPADVDGLVLIGGTQVIEGYLDLTDKTQTVLIEDDSYTWYKTTDKGHLDKDGFLIIVERLADV